VRLFSLATSGLVTKLNAWKKLKGRKLLRAIREASAAFGLPPSHMRVNEILYDEFAAELDSTY